MLISNHSSLYNSSIRIEASENHDLLTPLTLSYLDGVLSTIGRNIIEAKGGASAFIGTPIGCGDLP